MSSTSIEELLRAATSEADAVAARELALLALWIEQAQKTTVDLSEILGPARRAHRLTLCGAEGVRDACSRCGRRSSATRKPYGCES